MKKLIVCGIQIAVFFLWVKFFEKRKLRSIGFISKKPLIEYFKGALGWILQSASEEMAIRGWLIPTIGKGSNPIVAIVITALIFGIFHLFSAGVTVLSFINLTLSGLFPMEEKALKIRLGNPRGIVMGSDVMDRDILNNKTTKRLGEISLFMKDKNILWFIASTYLITWVFWLAAFKVNGIFRIIGSFVPSVIGILFIWRSDKEQGLKMLINRVKRYRVKWYVYFFVASYAILSFFIPYLLAGVFQNLEAFQVGKNIAIFDISNPLIALVCFATILIAGGPLGEEFGWRGFLLPQLEERFRPDICSIIVGVVWACWHLPMFLFHVEGYQMPFLLYLVQTIFMSMLCSWVYHTSGNSLLMVLLFHTMDNFVCSIAFQTLLNEVNLYSIFYWGIQIILVIYIVRDLKKYKIHSLPKGGKENVS